tara:strand:+ start:3840 stop:4406 length:567 start_codon:yes stop_codon:yes gene_type:complete
MTAGQPKSGAVLSDESERMPERNVPASLADLANGAALPEAAERPFWESKTLEELSPAEWESLCDGCGRCCLNKLEDWDTGEIHWTNIACRLLDEGSCRCRDYENRTDTVPDCIQLEPAAIRELTWLPPTCGYRLVGEGKPLFWWHPLVSGDPDTVHQAGMSVRGRTISEEGIELEDYERHLAAWPGED